MCGVVSDKKIRFLTKVVVAHIATYFLCGLIAFYLFDYADFVELLGFRPMQEIAVETIALGQIVRGILFGFVIWWIKDSVIGKRLGWLKLWGILIILGIFNSYGPNMGSIEGMIYLDLSKYQGVPVGSSFLSLLEITLQPLLFCIIVTFQRKKKHEQLVRTKIGEDINPPKAN